MFLSVDLQPLEDGTECGRREPRTHGCREMAANTRLIERSSSCDLTSLALFTSLAGITITKTRKAHKNRGSGGKERDGADDSGSEWRRRRRDELQNGVGGTGHGRMKRKQAESGVRI